VRSDKLSYHICNIAECFTILKGFRFRRSNRPVSHSQLSTLSAEL